MNEDGAPDIEEIEEREIVEEETLEPDEEVGGEEEEAEEHEDGESKADKDKEQEADEAEEPSNNNENEEMEDTIEVIVPVRNKGPRVSPKKISKAIRPKGRKAVRPMVVGKTNQTEKVRLENSNCFI